MVKMVLGFMLVDAPHSALNNAGADTGMRAENIVVAKVIRKGRKVYPYVSGQAVRYWWRKSLSEKANWNFSPIIREKKIAFTAANPIDYDDDDIFGYMRALKEKEGGTVTRISPLKNSPLVSVISQNPVQDFGVMARQEGDPVPYEHQFYSTVLKGIFSLDLDSVGVFHSKNRTGFKNMYPGLEKIAEKSGASKMDGKWILPKELRRKRAKDTISILPYIFGGAMQTSHLTDVSPKLLILTIIDGGNHIFMNVVKEVEGNAVLSVKAIEEVFVDYKEVLLTDVYIGRREGFMDEIDKELKGLVEKHKSKDRKFVYDSINKIVEKFVDKIPEHVG